MEEKEVKQDSTIETQKAPTPQENTGGGGGVDEKVPTVQE